jgi:hypothetical protein
VIKQQYLIIKERVTRNGRVGVQLLITATGWEYFKQLIARFEYVLDNFQVPEIMEQSEDLLTA